VYDLLLRELETLGIIAEEGSYLMQGRSVSREKIVTELSTNIKDSKKLIWSMWHEVSSELYSVVTDSAPSDSVRKLFIPAIQDLYELACCFSELEKCNIVKVITAALNRDIESFSTVTMSRIVDYSMSIGWLNHLIRRDMYTLAIIAKIGEKRETKAIGVAGPWSRTDIPMRERVFKWDEVSGETAGRGEDKRGQRRYRMGLEQYKDPWPNEGFVWREIRNEPYLFSDQDSSPYPHRDALFRN